MVPPVFLRSVVLLFAAFVGLDDPLDQLTHKDVVRHELVQRIIQAYERSEKQNQ